MIKSYNKIIDYLPEETNQYDHLPIIYAMKYVQPHILHYLLLQGAKVDEKTIEKMIDFLKGIKDPSIEGVCRDKDLWSKRLDKNPEDCNLVINYVNSTICADRLHKNSQIIIKGDINDDIVEARLKFLFQESGIDSDGYTYMDGITSNSSISSPLKNKIITLFSTAKNEFNELCAQLWNMYDTNISPTSLSVLLQHRLDVKFCPEVNLYTQKLLNFYKENNINFSYNVAEILKGNDSIDDEIIKKLNQELFRANVKILTDKLSYNLCFIAGTYEALVSFKENPFLPKELLDFMQKNIKSYENFKNDPISNVVMEEVYNQSQKHNETKQKLDQQTKIIQTLVSAVEQLTSIIKSFAPINVQEDLSKFLDTTLKSTKYCASTLLEYNHHDLEQVVETQGAGVCSSSTDQ